MVDCSTSTTFVGVRLHVAAGGVGVGFGHYRTYLVLVRIYNMYITLHVKSESHYIRTCRPYRYLPGVRTRY